MTDAPSTEQRTPLVWTMVKPGHYTAGDADATGYTVRRDPNASADNRWSLRHNARKVSAHRLLATAKRTAQTITDNEANAAAAPLPVTPQIPAIAATHGEPYVRGVATTYTEQPQQQVAQADEYPVPVCPDKEVHTKHRIAGTWRQECRGVDVPGALPTPTARPTPVEAVAAHYRETQQWPAASEVVRRGADLDELHQALGAGLVERVEYRGRAVYQLPAPGASEPLRADDVVTVDPLRCGRQFDVIDANIGGVDPELVQVFPRRPLSVEDTGRWVAREHTHRVPAEVVVPLDEGDDEQPECEGHESLNGADMGESVYCDGTCLNARGPVKSPAPPAEAPVPFAVGALVVRKADTAGARVLRVLGCEVRGGVTPAPYVKLVDPFDGKADGCYASGVRPATLAEGLRTSAPEQYREVLVHLLTPHGFTVPTGPDRLVLDLPDDGAFLVHDPTGVALCTLREAIRIAYPATHAGEGDGDVGIAWLDLTYGTSYETVADVAVGLSQWRGQAPVDPAAAEPQLPPVAEGDLVRLPAPYSQKRGYSIERVTGDMVAVILGGHRKYFKASEVTWYTLDELAVDQPAEAQPAYDFRPGDEWVDAALRSDVHHDGVHWHVRADADGEPELFEPNGPGLVSADAAQRVRGGMRLVSRVMHDDREIPFEFDGEVQPGYVAGWCGHRVARSEWRAGFRVCERCPKPGDDDQGAEVDVDAVLDGPAERPMTQVQVDSAECGKTFTSGRMGHTFPCARPPHPADDGIGCSVQRYPRPAGGTMGAGNVSDDDAETLVFADEGEPEVLVDAGGFLACGCHSSAREHYCGPSAPDTV